MKSYGVQDPVDKGDPDPYDVKKYATANKVEFVLEQFIERRSRSFGVRSTEDERLAAITTARIARAYKTPTQAGM